MKKRQTSNSSISKIAYAKIGSKYDQLKRSLSWREKGPSEDFIEGLCEEYIEWSTKPDSLDPVVFRHEFGIPKQTWYNLGKKFELFDLVNKHVYEVIGIRLLDAVMKGKLDQKTVHRTLHKYHPIWSEVVEEEKEFRKELTAKKVDDITTALLGKVFEVPRLDESQREPTNRDSE